MWIELTKSETAMPVLVNMSEVEHIEDSHPKNGCRLWFKSGWRMDILETFAEIR